MTIEEWVNQSREEQRERFGAVELKTDCVHCKKRTDGLCECIILNGVGKHIPCENGVCHFYKPRGAKND